MRPRRAAAIVIAMMVLAAGRPVVGYGPRCRGPIELISALVDPRWSTPSCGIST
jgi:hypothetical protein